jgi:ADP-L-glycero-D-manno-heptose 6-epimerase
MIIVTGAAGFIGSCLVAQLNEEGYKDIVVVDDFSRTDKNKNLSGKTYKTEVHRDVFASWLRENHRLVQFVFHLGARTDTTEFDKKIFDTLNVNFSKTIWHLCTEYGLPFVYASSAATYGGGEFGYDDSPLLIEKLKPLNPYGESKNEFDKYILQTERNAFQKNQQLPFWAGLKFFNVYGPNEYHKGRMASVVLHAFKQIKQNGKVNLFRSHKAEYKDGEQLRDFIYVKDVTRVCTWLLHSRKHSGIYNLGSGQANTFLSLVNALFASVTKKPAIEFIDTPSDIRDTYQYFTEAKMQKLIRAGYTTPFTPLNAGVNEYVQNYLLKEEYW